jgi:nucleoside 2-deoxyribosyltransferase
MRVYLAAPLFSQNERRWNRELAELLRERIVAAEEDSEIILPQDFRDRGKYNDRKRLQVLFEKCVEAVRGADVVVAVLDGPDVDSGVAFEMGYAHALGVPVVGLRTDFRQLQERGVNLMCSRPCTEYVCRMSFDEDLGHVADELARKVIAAHGTKHERTG